jgi:hypothetical protein
MNFINQKNQKKRGAHEIADAKIIKPKANKNPSLIKIVLNLSSKNNFLSLF